MCNIIRIYIIMLLFSLLSACSSQTIEKQRIPNSRGTLDAVIAERETDATVGTPTEVYVLAHGVAASGAPVLRMDKVEGIRVTWDSDGILTIHADTARIFLSLPVLMVKDAIGDKRTVYIRLDIKKVL